MEALKELGNQHIFNKSFFPVIQKMVAEFNGIRSCTGINYARYQRFCAKGKAPEPQQLPPTEDELLLHCQRATYVTCIWKSALSPNVDATDPVGHGWCKVRTETLEIKWMNQKPAPDALLEFLSCGCKKSECRNNRCVCVVNGLKCTDICGCTTCANSAPDEDDLDSYELLASDNED